MVDMRSDTLTLPTDEMRYIIANAVTGDDCYLEDESVNELQDYCSRLFEVEDSIFVSSGTMANQLAIRCHVDEGNEVITESNYHISFYESSSVAVLSRAVLNTTTTYNGILTVNDVNRLIKAKPRGYLYAKPQLVTVENTINNYQGKIFPMSVMKDLYNFTREEDLKLHLDGARLFNAHVATGIPLSEYARYCDSLTVCFAKGLAAPFGSILMGNKDFIAKARKYRKHLGGALHQVGMYANGALYALKNHISHLDKDHKLTCMLAEKLSTIHELEINKDDIQTNMIFFKVTKFNTTSDEFIKKCKQDGVLFFPWLPDTVRIVVHRYITENDIENAFEIILKNIESLCSSIPSEERMVRS